jgi:hypothetical protein
MCRLGTARAAEFVRLFEPQDIASAKGKDIMENAHHHFNELFAQLGLPNDDQGIHDFLTCHAPLAAEIRLAEAPFWSPVQAEMLRQQRCDDADWAELVDQLDAALRYQG